MHSAGLKSDNIMVDVYILVTDILNYLTEYYKRCFLINLHDKYFLIYAKLRYSSPVTETKKKLGKKVAIPKFAVT